MSRSVRAETRQRAKDEKKHHISNLFAARKWEKKWVTICDTTMRIYKWVPVHCSVNEQTKKLKQTDSSQSSMNDKENSKITRTDEDSNTCFSFSEIQFQNSSDKFLFSEDSNSQSSDTTPAKKFKSSND